MGAILTTEMIVVGEWVVAVFVFVALVAPSKRLSIPVAGGKRRSGHQISGGQRQPGHWNSLGSFSTVAQIGFSAS